MVISDCKKTSYPLVALVGDPFPPVGTEKQGAEILV
jgi:hypothetical protein